MELYLQVNYEGYITDCLEYKHDDYIKVNLTLPLPEHFIAGCYKYIGNNEYVHDDEKHDELFNI